MQRRHLFASSMLLTLICASPVFATDSPIETSQFRDWSIRWDGVDFDPNPIYYAPETSFLDSVTITRLPPGSLRVSYAGPLRLLFKYANSQFRRFVRKYQAPEEDPIRLDTWNNTDWSVDSWWRRSWLDSLPSEKGGAPDEVYHHVVGKEIHWRFGPITFSNTLRVKLDYVAVFKLDTDPTDFQGEPKKARVVIDIHTPKGGVAGTRFKFRLRPHIRVALLKTGDWAEFLKTASIRAELDIIIRGKRVLKGMVELRYEPDDGLRFEINLEFVSW